MCNATDQNKLCALQQEGGCSGLHPIACPAWAAVPAIQLNHALLRLSQPCSCAGPHSPQWCSCVVPWCCPMSHLPDGPYALGPQRPRPAEAGHGVTAALAALGAVQPRLTRAGDLLVHRLVLRPGLLPRQPCRVSSKKQGGKVYACRRTLSRRCCNGTTAAHTQLLQLAWH